MATGKGIGVGYSPHWGMVIVTDGAADADKRVARLLWNDAGSGVMLDVDAGYEIARARAEEQGLKLPML